MCRLVHIHAYRYRYRYTLPAVHLRRQLADRNFRILSESTGGQDVDIQSRSEKKTGKDKIQTGERTRLPRNEERSSVERKKLRRSASFTAETTLRAVRKQPGGTGFLWMGLQRAAFCVLATQPECRGSEGKALPQGARHEEEEEEEEDRPRTVHTRSQAPSPLGKEMVEIKRGIKVVGEAATLSGRDSKPNAAGSEARRGKAD